MCCWFFSSEDLVFVVVEINEGVDNFLKKFLEYGIKEEKIVCFGSLGWKVVKDLECLMFEFKYC